MKKMRLNSSNYEQNISLHFKIHVVRALIIPSHSLVITTMKLHEINMFLKRQLSQNNRLKITRSDCSKK